MDLPTISTFAIKMLDAIEDTTRSSITFNPFRLEFVFYGSSGISFCCAAEFYTLLRAWPCNSEIYSESAKRGMRGVLL